MPAKNNVLQTLTHEGRTLSVEAWARETGIPSATLRARLGRLEWPAAKALTTPPQKKFARSPGRPATAAVRPVPKLTKHAGGQAHARWMQGGNRHYRYFGPWGSTAARAGYAAFVREWADIIAGTKPVPVKPGATTSVGELVGRWLDRCKERYVKLGKPTSEYHCQRSACAVLLARYATLSVANFGLEHLEHVRADMVAKDWVRGSVNKNVSRVVAAFGWGVPRKLVPADVHYTLRQIESLTAGATTAPEGEPVRSAPPEHVLAVLADDHLHADPIRQAVLAAMIRVQLLTGMRPGAVCAMKPEMVSRAGGEWRYDAPPEGNKNFHRDQPLTVWIGPKAQEILGPLLDAAKPGEPVFRFPRLRDKELEFRRLTVTDYGRFVAAACKRAKVEPWTPHQLRHNRATEVKRVYESDAAAARAIGTTEDVAARIYVDPQEVVDRRIARETG